MDSKNKILYKLRIKLRRNLFLASIVSFYSNFMYVRRRRFGYIDPTARVNFPICIKGIDNVFLYEETLILGHAIILTTEAKFIMKRLSSAAQGLTVVTGNHFPALKEWFNPRCRDANILRSKDIIVEEDVWIGANVTLLPGVIIGRGATIGAGSVCRISVPPYAIVIGNPAKIIGFNFTPKQIIEHEKSLYSEGDRLGFEMLEQNYNRYYRNRLNVINSFLKL